MKRFLTALRLFITSVGIIVAIMVGGLMAAFVLFYTSLP